jgi:DNA-binding SARP family transcriptional activator
MRIRIEGELEFDVSPRAAGLLRSELAVGQEMMLDLSCTQVDETRQIGQAPLGHTHAPQQRRRDQADVAAGRSGSVVVRDVRGVRRLRGSETSGGFAQVGNGQPQVGPSTAWRSRSEADAHTNSCCRAKLRLLGAFELTWDGEPMSLPLPAQRLLAFLALSDRPVSRTYVAERLWLDSSEERACASLRSALWRLRKGGHELVDVSSGRLRLAPEVVVDVRLLDRWARSTLEASNRVGASLPALSILGDAISGDLLPEWYDDWLTIERERLRELRVRALEQVSQQLASAGSFAQALEAGLAAVHAEPLRESAHRCLVAVYLAEGNQAEALRAYGVYRKLLLDQLGLEPSPRMRDMVDGLLAVDGQLVALSGSLSSVTHG